MQIDQLRAHLEQYPEVGSATWASLRATFRESRRRLFELPPDVRAMLQMLRTARSGDVPQALAQAEMYLGRRLDMMLRNLSEGEFASPRRSVIPVVLQGLNYHKDRLATPPTRWYQTRKREVYQRLRKSSGRRLIKGLMTLDELENRLKEIEATRETARTKLAILEEGR
jgi:hypothetical protein